MSLFASPWMLLWLGAALAPWLIHLWLRQRQREIRWGAMQWVLLATQRQSRPLRFWQWLLLLLRTLALMLLALAVAQPLGCRQLKTMGSRAPRIQVLVLDASYSMQTQIGAGEGTRWDQAIREAKEACDQAVPGDRFLCVLLADPPRVLIPTPTSDTTYIKQRLEESRCGLTASDWSATARVIDALVGKVIQDETDSTSCHLLIWSDQQERTWLPAVEAQALEVNNALSEKVTAEFRSLADRRRTPNAAWQNLDIATQLPISTRPLELRAQIRNFDDRPIEGRIARLLVDGVVRESQRIDISANSSQSVDFAVRLEAGEHILCVESDADALPVDDRRWGVATIRERIRVAVFGEPKARELMVAALAPDDSDPSIEVLEGELSDRSLLNQRVEVIFLCDPGRITTSLAEAIERQVAQGTSLWTWCGPRAIPETLNRVLWERKAGPLLPAKVGTASEPGIYRIDPLEYQHPIVAPFAAYPGAGLTSVPVFRYRKVSDPLPESEVVMALEGNMPWVLVARREKRGAVGLVTVPADVGQDTDNAWTGFAAWPSFLPFVQQLVQWSVSTSTAHSLLIGQSIQGNGGDESATTIEIRKPEGGNQRIPLNHLPEGTRWRLMQTEQMGIYQYHDGVQDRSIAVNVDASEGDLAIADWSPLVDRFESLKDQEKRSSADSERSMKTPLFRFLLAGLLAVLVAEMSVVRWMQRRFG